MSLTDLKLSHYCSEPAVVMEPREQDLADMKPLGLWVSVDGEMDWPSWCLAEHFSRGEDLRFQHRVTLAPDHRVLHLSSGISLRWLTNKYPDHKYRELGLGSNFRLDWRRLAQDHDGLVISPYLWECRLDHDVFWYYGWDCASGCIWNPRSVASVEMVRKTDYPDVIRAAVAEQDRESDELWAKHPATTETESRMREMMLRWRSQREAKGKR